MSKRQKFIASCCQPLYGGLSTRAEVKKVKLMARGKYWVEDLQFGCPASEEEHDTFCAYSPTGKRYFFHFDWSSAGTKKQKVKWKNEARQAARLWCKGKYKDALRVYDNSYKSSYESSES